MGLLSGMFEGYGKAMEFTQQFNSQVTSLRKNLGSLHTTQSKGVGHHAMMAESAQNLATKYRILGQMSRQGATGASALKKQLRGTGQVAEFTLGNFRSLFLFAGFGAMFIGQAFTKAADKIKSALKSMIDTFKEFQWNVRRANILAGQFNSRQGELWQRAIQLGQDTIYTASEAAEGMQELARAGLNVEETSEVIGGVLNLAQIEMADLADTTKIAISALHGFGMMVDEVKAEIKDTTEGIAGYTSVQKDMNRVVENAAYAVRQSALEMKEYGEALKYVAPVAAQAGISIENVSAAIMGAANAGIRGGQAGRHLRNIILKTSEAVGVQLNQFSNAKEVLNKYGDQLQFTKNKQLKGFVDIAKEWKGLIQEEDLTKVQAMNAMMAVYNRRQAQTMMALANVPTKEMEGQLRDLYSYRLKKLKEEKNGIQDVAKWLQTQRERLQGYNVDIEESTKNLDLSRTATEYLAKAIKGSQENLDKLVQSFREVKTASQMAKEQLDSIKGKMRQVGASVESLQIAAITPLAGTFQNLLSTIKNILNALAQLDQRIYAVFSSFIALSWVVSSVAGKLFSALFPMLMISSTLVTISAAARNQMAVGHMLQDMYQTWAKTINKLLIPSLRRFLATWGLTITAIGAGVAIFFSLWYLWSNQLIPMQEKISKKLESLGQNFKLLYTKIKELIGEALDPLITFFTDIIGFFKEGEEETRMLTKAYVTLISTIDWLTRLIGYLAIQLDHMSNFLHDNKKAARILSITIGVSLIPVLTNLINKYLALVGVEAGIWGLVAAHTALFSVILPLIPIVAGWIYLWKNDALPAMQRFKEAASRIVDSIIPLTDAIIDLVAAAFAPFGELLLSIYNLFAGTKKQMEDGKELAYALQLSFKAFVGVLRILAHVLERVTGFLEWYTEQMRKHKELAVITAIAIGTKLIPVLTTLISKYAALAGMRLSRMFGDLQKLQRMSSLSFSATPSAGIFGATSQLGGGGMEKYLNNWTNVSKKTKFQRVLAHKIDIVVNKFKSLGRAIKSAGKTLAGYIKLIGKTIKKIGLWIATKTKEIFTRETSITTKLREKLAMETSIAVKTKETLASYHAANANTTLSIATTGLTGTLWAATKAAWAFLTGIAPYVAVGAAVIGVLYMLNERFNIISKTVAFFKGLINGVRNFITGLINKIKTWWNSLGEVQKALILLMNPITAIIGLIKLFKKAIDHLRHGSGFTALISTIGNTLSVLNPLKAIFEGIIMPVKMLYRLITLLASDGFDKVVNNLKKMAKGFDPLITKVSELNTELSQVNRGMNTLSGNYQTNIAGTGIHRGTQTGKGKSTNVEINFNGDLSVTEEDDISKLGFEFEDRVKRVLNRHTKK